MKETQSTRPNKVNHQENLSKLHGVFWHGRYFHEGIPQPHKIDSKFPEKGSIKFK